MAIPSSVNIQTLDLDMTNYEIVVAYAEQYEKNTTQIKFNLYNAGVPISIDSNATINLKGTKPDGTLLVYSNTGASNVISYTTGTNILMVNVVQQMTTVDGRVKFALEIVLGDKRKFTSVFYLRIRKSPLDEGAVESTNDYKDLEDTIVSRDEEYKREIEEIISDYDGVIIQKGNAYFAQLDSLDKQSGFMYNIKDEFWTDNRFEDYDPTVGSQHYDAGQNIYWNDNDKWDILSGTLSMEETVDIDFEHDWNTQS